jgi:hypothetical protein
MFETSRDGKANPVFSSMVLWSTTRLKFGLKLQLPAHVYVLVLIFCYVCFMSCFLCCVLSVPTVDDLLACLVVVAQWHGNGAGSSYYY